MFLRDRATKSISLRSDASLSLDQAPTAEQEAQLLKLRRSPQEKTQELLFFNCLQNFESYTSQRPHFGHFTLSNICNGTFRGATRS